MRAVRRSIDVISRGFGDLCRSPALHCARQRALHRALPCALHGAVLAAGIGAPLAAQGAPIPAESGATITFGREGGSIRPRSFAIAADGRIRAGNAAPAAPAAPAPDSVATIPPGAVEALVRLARTGGFWDLRSRTIRRPPANPDAAREFISVSLTCGTHRAEFVSGGAPPVFAEFFALLATLARSP